MKDEINAAFSGGDATLVFNQKADAEGAAALLKRQDIETEVGEDLASLLNPKGRRKRVDPPASFRCEDIGFGQLTPRRWKIHDERPGEIRAFFVRLTDKMIEQIADAQEARDDYQCQGRAVHD